MHPSELLENYWKMLLSGETVGSVRGRVTIYGISQSTIQRMDKEKKAVIAKLQQDAIDGQTTLDVAYIRTNAPLWKEMATWRDGKPSAGSPELNRKAVEGILRTLALRFTDHAKAQPDVLLEAFQEFFEGATGRHLEIKQGDDGAVDPNDDF